MTQVKLDSGKFVNVKMPYKAGDFVTFNTAGEFSPLIGGGTYNETKNVLILEIEHRLVKRRWEEGPKEISTCVTVLLPDGYVDDWILRSDLKKYRRDFLCEPNGYHWTVKEVNGVSIREKSSK